MTYNELIDIVSKHKTEIKYYHNGKTTIYTLYYGCKEIDIHPNVIKKIKRMHYWREGIYAIEGSEETGWLIIKERRIALSF